MTSRLVVNSVRHTGASADALTLDSSGGVTIPTKKLNCPGTIIQVVSATKTNTASFAVASGAISHYTDSSLKVTITPTSASNTLHIMGHVVIGRELLNWVYVGIGKDGAEFTQGIGNADGSRRRMTVAAVNGYTDIPYSLPFHAKVTAENTSERYYNLCFSHASSSTRTLYLNRGSTDTDNVYYFRGISTITVMEIQA
tara:strand:- start:39 stop:632 length:594 start_codon:yes stop_codon:yes gene_type:complete